MLPNTRKLARRVGVWLLLLAAVPASARIISCVDDQGRRHTSDRPIPDCMNREQSELNPSGTVRRKIGPALSDQERADEQDRERQAAIERQRYVVERQRDQALLVRYPDKAAHDRERALALQQYVEVIKIGNKRLSELQDQRATLENELESPRRDPQRTPAIIRRQLQENQQSLEAQEQYVAEQQAEKKRINQRFDAELEKLRGYWLRKPASPALAPEPRLK